MDNRRQNKIGSLIKEVMTEVLQKEGKGIFGNALVSVTNVKVTSDLTLARFYFSIYNAPDTELVMKQLWEAKNLLKKSVAVHIRNLRKIPEFEFFQDDTLEHAERINKIFEEIKLQDQKLKDEQEKAD